MIYDKKLYDELIKNFTKKGYDYLYELDSEKFNNDEFILDVLQAGGSFIDAKSIYAKNIMLAGRDLKDLSLEEKLAVSDRMKEVQLEEREKFLAIIVEKMDESQSADEKR